VAETTPSPLDLTTVATVTSRGGITSPGDDDAIIQDIITAVSAAIRAEVGRSILSAAFTERYNGNGQARLWLRNFPVTAVTSLKVFEVEVTAAADVLSPGYLVDPDGKSIYLTPVSSAGVPGVQIGVFPWGEQNVEVAYTAGGDAVVLADLGDACVRQTLNEYNARTREGQNSKSLGGEVISFEREAFLPAVQRAIDRSRRVTRRR
jgi:hypothetical protein